jgi:hypothetical protein
MLCRENAQVNKLRRLRSLDVSQLKMKKAFDGAKAANQFAEQTLFLLRCFLLCGLLFHWHDRVPPMERTPLNSDNR